MPRSIAFATTALALLATLSACTSKPGNSTDALDNELVNGIDADGDSALTSALGNQIVGRSFPHQGCEGRQTLGDRAKAQAAAAPGCAEVRFQI